MSGTDSSAAASGGSAPDSPGTRITLPSGAIVRGRGRDQSPASPDFTVLLAGGPAPADGEHRRIRWPDFWIPVDPASALETLGEALDRARAGERVEIACRGGIGRTGTALCALAIMDGVPRREAVDWVRQRYHRHAVETPWQRWWLWRVTPRPVLT